MVIESGGKVIVNINDALNSNHENVVMMFLEVLQKHWPHIDILISGFSGAGYFPNQVRYPNKNDRRSVKCANITSPITSASMWSF